METEEQISSSASNSEKNPASLLLLLFIHTDMGLNTLTLAICSILFWSLLMILVVERLAVTFLGQTYNFHLVGDKMGRFVLTHI